MTRPLRHRLVSILIAASALLAGAPAFAAPDWSRIDTGTGAVVAPDGRIGQANAVGDSVWIRVLDPDGAIRWTTHWDLATTRNLWVKALVPTSEAGWILAMDTADGVGSWMVRLDSLGRQVGSPMGMRHDTCLTLFVAEGGSGETWAVPSTLDGRASSFYRFDSLGRFKDSTRLYAWGDLQGVRVLSGKLVAWQVQSADKVQCLLLFGTKGGKDSVVFLGSDSLRDAAYSPVLHSGLDSSGVERLVMAADSGTLDVVQGAMPRVRVVGWVVRSDSLARTLDATNELVLPEALWYGKDGNLLVAGVRRTAASAGGIAKFEPAAVRLDDKFRQAEIRAAHPGGSPTTSMGSVFAGSFPDGSGYVGIGNGNSTSIALLDGEGDSINALTLATTYTVNAWHGLPGGRLVNLGQSSDGKVRGIESWSTTGSTSLRGRRPTCSSLQSFAGGVVLELDHSVSAARLDRVDLQGRLLESRRLGSLPAGRHFWDVAGRSPGLVRLRLDGETLVAKVPARLR
jgi:hypothetical protein